MLDQAAIHPEWDGFGTTMTAAWSLGKDLFVMNIGDSRAYLFRNNQLMQLTSDHTLAQELVRQGVIRQDEVATNRFKNVLTKCLGSDNRASEPDVQKMTLLDGDVLLLCTDGLTDMVDHEEIASVLAGRKSCMIACEELLAMALEAGGKDNVSIIIARYQLPPEAPAAAETDTTPG
jgi:protein phosphatase